MTLPRGPSWIVPPLVRYLFDPYGVFGLLAGKYGDPFFLPVPGSRGTVVTGDPDGIKAILGADTTTLVPWRMRATEGLVGEHSIFLQAGEQHRAVRRSVAPPFHSTRLPDYAELMTEAAERHVGALQAGSVVAAHQLAQLITLDIILAVLFGRIDGERSRRYHATVGRFDRIGPAFMYLKVLRHDFWGVGPWAESKRLMFGLRDLLREELRDRRAGRGSGGMVEHLMAVRDDDRALTDEEIVGRMSDLVVAGHETSAVAIAWTIYELCRNPDVLERATAEVDRWTGAGVTPKSLPYLEAVCHETLRLHPTLVFLTRMVAKPLDVCGFEVPPGVGVSLAVPLVHMREELYPEPHRFVPDRFLGRSYATYEYLPFGGGAKRCIGAAFAIQEMMTAVAVLLRHWRFALVHNRPIRATPRVITVAPVGGVRIVLREERRAPPPVRRAPARPEPSGDSASP